MTVMTTVWECFAISLQSSRSPQSTTAGWWRGRGIPQTPFKNCSILGVFCVRRKFLNLWNAVNERLLLIWAFLLIWLMLFIRFFLLFVHKTSCLLRDDHQSHMWIAGINSLRIENGQQNKNKHPSLTFDPPIWYCVRWYCRYCNLYTGLYLV